LERGEGKGGFQLKRSHRKTRWIGRGGKLIMGEKEKKRFGGEDHHSFGKGKVDRGHFNGRE